MHEASLNKRATTLAYYILENNSTIRATAKVFNLAKSTVHHDLSIKLKYINFNLYKKVKHLLENNFKIKHLHGGEATKIKYMKIKCNINKNDELEILKY